MALDIGTTTLRVLLIRLSDGTVIGEAGAYNPQIARGADVISRIVAAEKGLLGELASLVRNVVVEMIVAAAAAAQADVNLIRAYMVAGNVTMVHLLLGEDPSGIRRVPSEPRALAFGPVGASALGWPGVGHVPVYTLPAAGGWVGGDIVAGVVRAGLSRASDRLTLYVDLGTNGEIVFGGADFALACACSAGPAFEGGGIRCGMRADPGAIDGARVTPDEGSLAVSVIGGARATGVCGSGLIALTHALFSARWIDRGGRFTDGLPSPYRLEGPWGMAVALDERGQAAIGIGLLPELPFGQYSYVDNGSLEGAALALLSREFLSEVTGYLGRITYVDLSDLPRIHGRVRGRLLPAAYRSSPVADLTRLPASQPNSQDCPRA